MTRIRHSLLLCAPLVLISTPSSAEIELNGFASIVIGSTLDRSETLYGFEDKLNFKEESKLALQASSDLGEGVKATAQLLSVGKDDFETKLEWAFISYDVTDQWSVNAGRSRMPFYMHSEYVDVGYAYKWVRPSQDLYSIPFNSFESLGVTGNLLTGDVSHRVQMKLGRLDESITSEELGFPITDDETELDTSYSLELVSNYEWLTTRVGYFQANNVIFFPNGQANPPVPPLMDEADIDFYAVGFSIDYADFLFDTEYALLSPEDGVFLEQESLYISLAKRIGLLTPYVFYSQKENTAQFMNDTTVRDSTTLSIGARYDVHSNVGLKVDYTTLDDDINSAADASLLSASIDLIF